MHQSPDDIFAAHFWAWPDPALKRDAHGRVLFVNAAFLQLFGGRVEDWRGQTVGGWQPPQPGPVPARFEIRTPATPDLPEQVYDWMELAGPDGSAFALARNVTAFSHAAPPDAPASAPAPRELQQPVDAAPVFDDAPAPGLEPVIAHGAPDLLAPPPPAMATPAGATPPDGRAAEAVPVPDLPVVQAPAVTVADADVPALDVPPVSAPALDVPAITVPDITAEPAPVMAPDLAPDLPPAPAIAPEPRQAAPAQQPATATAPDPEPERAYERRALPIENDEAVLGNNWRDAVIAKAVGAPDATDEVAPAEAAPEAVGEGVRILLAEDNAINALLTRTLLEAEGHSVETVEDGVLAVEAMKTSRFDLIFMDMRMPNMDGLEATRKIRALPNVPANLPIIALTANAFDDDRNACFDSGMNDFMTKPVSAEELSDMVSRWTGAQAQALAS